MKGTDLIKKLTRFWKLFSGQPSLRVQTRLAPASPKPILEGSSTEPPTRKPFVPGVNRKRIPRKPQDFWLVALINCLGERVLVFAEQPARLRQTKWDLGGNCSDRVLSFPRMLFVVCFYRAIFENLYAFFLQEPYSGRATRLFQSPLPNITDFGWVCIGSDATKDELMAATAKLDTWQAKVDQVLNFFWNETHFGEDLIERLNMRGPLLHPNLASLARWETASRLDPKFINSVSWDFAGTVEDFLHNRIPRRS